MRKTTTSCTIKTVDSYLADGTYLKDDKELHAHVIDDDRAIKAFVLFLTNSSKEEATA